MDPTSPTWPQPSQVMDQENSHNPPMEIKTRWDRSGLCTIPALQLATAESNVAWSHPKLIPGTYQ